MIIRSIKQEFVRLAIYWNKKKKKKNEKIFKIKFARFPNDHNTYEI